MRRRWQVLFGFAILTLVGMSWLAARFGQSLSIFDLPQVGGTLIAAAAALFGALKNYQQKWPAGVAFVCSLSLSWSAVRALELIADIAGLLGPPGFLMLGGSIATTATALFILVKPVPVPPADPIAPAKIV